MVIGSFLFLFRRRYFEIVLIFSYTVLALMIQKCIQEKAKKACIIVGIVTVLYMANNLAGDMYLLWKNRHVEPFHVIETYLQTHIPKHARVLSHLEFWTGVYHATWVRSLDALQPHDYVVLSDTFKDAISPVTRDTRDVHQVKKGETSFYTTTKTYVETHATLRHSKQTYGYGTIQVWQINP